MKCFSFLKLCDKFSKSLVKADSCMRLTWIKLLFLSRNRLTLAASEQTLGHIVAY